MVFYQQKQLYSNGHFGLITALKPKSLDDWQHIAQTDNYAAIIAQALYGESFEVSGGQGGVSRMIALSQEQQRRSRYRQSVKDKQGYGLLHIKKTTHTNPYFLTNSELDKSALLEVELHFTAEPDEFWSFVQNKSNQRWRWYVIERRSGIILARHNGKRQDKDFLQFWELLKAFPISKYHTDDWGAHSKYIPPDKHRIGKDRTWKIERKNLNFRTHLKRLNRKTICFSKNEQKHDNVIWMCIEKYYYKTGTYGNNSS